MFRGADWTAPTPVGGRSGNWDDNMNGLTAASSVSGAAMGGTQMTAIDAKIDCSDHSTGQFIKANTRYT